MATILHYPNDSLVRLSKATQFNNIGHIDLAGSHLLGCYFCPTLTVFSRRPFLELLERQIVLLVWNWFHDKLRSMEKPACQTSFNASHCYEVFSREGRANWSPNQVVVGCWLVLLRSHAEAGAQFQIHQPSPRLYIIWKKCDEMPIFRLFWD